MAEVFGVVASGVGVASFAIQIADSMKKLKDFWDSVKEAPDEIIFVLEELETYTALLGEIQFQTDANDLPSVSAAAITKSKALCQKSLDTLLVAVKEAETYIAAKRRRGSVKYVLKKDVMARNRVRLESARNLLTVSYNVYCGGLSKYQIELQRMSIELQRKSQDLQIVASQNPEGTTDSPMPKSTRESKASADGSEHLPIQEVTGDHDFIQRTLPLIPRRTTWAEYFAGSVAYRKGVLKQKKLGGDSLDGKKYMWQFRIRFPSWWKAQIWDIHVGQAQSGWTNSLQVYNIVPYNSLQFRYAATDQVELLRDLFLAGKASPYDITENGQSLLVWSAQSPTTSTCRFLLETGHSFEQDRGFHFRSPIDSFCTRGLTTTHACTETFDLLLKHTGPSLTDDDDLYADVRGGSLSVTLVFLPALLLQKFVDFYNVRHAIPINGRLDMASNLIGDLFWPYTDKELDEAIRKLYLILGHDCSDLEVLGFSPPNSEKLGDCSGRLFGYGIRWQHQEALNLARKFRKIAIELNSGVLEPEFLRTAIEAFYFAFFKEGFSSFALYDSKEALIMWLTELSAAGLDLERYGEQLKSRKIMTPFYSGVEPYSRLPDYILGYLGQAEAIVVYGPKPTDWKLYWSTPMDEYSGAFWCMIEKPFGTPMPGSWTEERWQRIEVHWEECGIYHWWESEDWNDWTLGLI